MRARRLIAVSLVILSCVTSATLAPQHAHAYEHVRNGGFEAGTDGWWPRNDTLLDVVSMPEPMEGEHVARVTLTGQSFELQASTSGTIAPGQYEFSAYVLTPHSDITVEVSVAGRGFEESRTFEPVAGAWMPVALAVHPQLADDPAITIAGIGPPGAVLYIDDVRLDGAAPVTRTPTPSVTAPPLAPASDTTPPPALTSSPQPTATPLVDTIASYVRNASFEDVDGAALPFAWRKFGGELSSVTSPVHAGERAARLDSATDAMKWMYQAVRVEPGATYAFDAWVWDNDPGVASTFLRISWYTSADASGQSIATSDATAPLTTPEAAFRPVTTGPVTAPSNARSAKLRIVLVPVSAAPAAIVVDSVGFGPSVPLPPTPADAAEDGDSAPPAASAGSHRGRTGGGDASYDASGHAVGAAPYTGATTLVINEVLYDPDLAGTDADGEWVELYNTSDSDISLAGWSLRDGVRVVALPNIIVPGQDFAIIAASDSFLGAYPGFDGVVAWLGGRIGNGLGNEGDVLELLAPDGIAVDGVSWGDDSSAFVPPVDDVRAGHSIERSPAGLDTNAADDFVENASPSPGRAFEAGNGNPNQQIGQRTVEILAGSGQSQFQWVPWAIVALSGVALAGALGWRVLDTLRSRTPAP